MATSRDNSRETKKLQKERNKVAQERSKKILLMFSQQSCYKGVASYSDVLVAVVQRWIILRCNDGRRSVTLSTVVHYILTVPGT